MASAAVWISSPASDATACTPISRPVPASATNLIKPRVSKLASARGACRALLRYDRSGPLSADRGVAAATGRMTADPIPGCGHRRSRPVKRCNSVLSHCGHSPRLRPPPRKSVQYPVWESNPHLLKRHPPLSQLADRLCETLLEQGVEVLVGRFGRVLQRPAMVGGRPGPAVRWTGSDARSR